MDILSSLRCAFALCATIFFIISLARAKSSSSAKNLPPGPYPLPILGNLVKLLPNTSTIHKILAELARTHGPIMTLKLGSITTIVVSSSSIAKQVLKTNLVPYTPDILDAVRAHEHDKFSIGSLPSSSSKWRTLRRISTKLFSGKVLDTMQTYRYKELDDLLNYIGDCSKNNVSIDVGRVVYDAIFNSMSNAMFSVDMEGDGRVREIRELMNSIIKEIGRLNIVDGYPMLKMFDPQRIRHRLTSLSRKLFEIFDEIIEVRLKSRADQVNTSHSYNDLLEVVLDLPEEQRDEMSREHIHHLLLDILGAGIDTTSVAMEWAMSELLRHPLVLRKCQEEIDRVVGKGKTILESDISQLPYLQAIVKETLRLYPPAPLLLPRKVEQDTNIGEYTVPKGARLIVNVWAIGRDPHAWDKPETFFPERFLESQVDVKGQHFELIPFGSGKKMCAGMPLALRMVSSMLGSLISSFDWKLEDDGDLRKDLDMDDKYGITIKKARPLRAFPITRA